MCDIPQRYVVSCAGCELNSPSWFPDQGAPSPPGERDCCGDRSSGLLRRCWLSEPSCRLHVSVPSGAGVSARPGDCTALGLPCAHTARREPGLIMLELHVSSPVHFGEYIDTKWDYDLIRPLSGAFAGSPALSGQSPASLGQHLVVWAALTSQLPSAGSLHVLLSVCNNLTRPPFSPWASCDPHSRLRFLSSASYHSAWERKAPPSVKDTCPTPATHSLA